MRSAAVSDVGYPKVKVSGAPGYADFDGELVMNLVSADGRLLSTVEFVWEGKRDTAIVPRRCVTYAPGTRVTLNDPDFGPAHGQVVVCLCKRHTYQPAIGGTECGHKACGYPRTAGACPWPMHVRWDDGNESHQGADIEPCSIGGE